MFHEKTGKLVERPTILTIQQQRIISTVPLEVINGGHGQLVHFRRERTQILLFHSLKRLRSPIWKPSSANMVSWLISGETTESLLLLLLPSPFQLLPIVSAAAH